MRNKKVLYILTFIFLVIGLALWHFSDILMQNSPIETITYNNASPDLVKVEIPFPGAVTGKTFSVLGHARGGWYHEATFPITLLDKDGNTLVETYATAEGEWMTENFVPFKAEVKAPESYIGKATLVLHRSNASGLPEHEASISFPITVEY